MADVEIAAPSARDELVAVVRVAMAIIAAVWIYLTNGSFPGGGGAVQRGLLPYQKFVQDLPSGEQRMFRELQVGLLEAETLRSTEGAWPGAERLAADLIEPFAPNPTTKGSEYEWRMLRDGFFINYMGIPRQPGAPAWLILVQEPDPAAPPEIAQDDEDHDRLVDGSILHVSIWNHAEGARMPLKLVQVPQAEGWMQWYAVGPSPAP